MLDEGCSMRTPSTRTPLLMALGASQAKNDIMEPGYPNAPTRLGIRYTLKPQRRLRQVTPMCGIFLIRRLMCRSFYCR